MSAHQLALNAGYVDEVGSRVWITTAGAQIYASGREAEIFDRFATAFPHFRAPAKDDPKSMDILRNVFERLTLEEFCEPFGLVRVEDQPSRGDGPGGRRYETTRLFRELFEWRTL